MLLPLPPELDVRRQAMFLYFAGWRCSDIAAATAQPEATIRTWKSRDSWDETPTIRRVEACLEAKYIQLLIKEPKDGRDVRDLDLYGRQIEKLARVRRYGEPGGHEGDLRPAIEARNSGPRRKPKRNVFSDEQAAKLTEIFHEKMFGYQREWFENANLRSRMILKSRQIGATWYFAREALVDAVTTGRNQIFLSASKNQAHVFKGYIIEFAAEAGVELVGDPIVLPNGAQLHFLGMNARTAQGYTGNFYFDEFFWTFGFKELNKVAAAMASHQHWRKTYFSTPSSVTHEAYAFWTGSEWNARRAKADKQLIDVSASTLQAGATGADRIWRQMVTVEDAARTGCDLFDIDELREENAADQFANLYMCEFIDDTASVFPMAELKRCMVDALSEWDDFDFAAQIMGRRPFGRKKVWIGYDPAATGDNAALVVVAAPEVAGKSPFRCLEKHQWRGMDFAGQAAAIRSVCQRFEVDAIVIDETGMGLAVLQLVRQFFPRARGVRYSPETKTRMVLKAKDVTTSQRLQFDAGWTDLAAAMMSVRRAMTASGRQATYEAPRDAVGHADLAWALFHVLDNEPLEAAHGGGAKRSTVEIYG